MEATLYSYDIVCTFLGPVFQEHCHAPSRCQALNVDCGSILRPAREPWLIANSKQGHWLESLSSSRSVLPHLHEGDVHQGVALAMQGMDSKFQVMQVCNVFQRGLWMWCCWKKSKGPKDADTSQLSDVAHKASSRRSAKTKDTRETIEMVQNAWNAQKMATGILADNSWWGLHFTSQNSSHIETVERHL